MNYSLDRLFEQRGKKLRDFEEYYAIIYFLKRSKHKWSLAEITKSFRREIGNWVKKKKKKILKLYLFRITHWEKWLR